MIGISCSSLWTAKEGTTNLHSAKCPQDRRTEPAPDDSYTQKNPYVSPDDVASGKAMYQGEKNISGFPVACVTCHGKEGKGDGPTGKSFKSPKVSRNFTCKETMKDITPGQMFWIIKNGSPGTAMIPWTRLSDMEIWQIVAYIESAFVKR